MSKLSISRPKVPNRSTLPGIVQDLIVPVGDNSKYRYITLKNGLKCILVHDPSIEASAVCLRVNIGNECDAYLFENGNLEKVEGIGQNNCNEKTEKNEKNEKNQILKKVEKSKEIYGLAHSCEHFCFLGSKSYPIENTYKNMINKYSGRCNASTGSQYTNFYFKVNSTGFFTILPIFSEFFSSPLFSPAGISREINAVNNEHVRNIQNDGRRLLAISRNSFRETHPYHYFHTGNHYTMKYYLSNIDPTRSYPVYLLEDGGEGMEKNKKEENNRNNAQSPELLPSQLYLREATMAFHSAFYTSDRMQLVIVSNHPLDEVQNATKINFEKIKPSNFEQNKNDQNNHNFNNFQLENYFPRCDYEEMMKRIGFRVDIDGYDRNINFEGEKEKFEICTDNMNNKNNSEQIKNKNQTSQKNIVLNSLQNLKLPFKPHPLLKHNGKIFEFAPINNTRMINLIWTLPSSDTEFFSKNAKNQSTPLESSKSTLRLAYLTICRLLNQRHENSLSFFLQKSGFIIMNGIHSSYRNGTGYSSISIDISLTAVGILHVSDILRIIYSYLHFFLLPHILTPPTPLQTAPLDIKNQHLSIGHNFTPSQLEICNYSKNLFELSDFDFNFCFEPHDPLQLSRSLSESLESCYSIEDIVMIFHDVRDRDINFDVLASVVALLTPENSIVIIVAKEAEYDGRLCVAGPIDRGILEGKVRLPIKYDLKDRKIRENGENGENGDKNDAGIISFTINSTQNIPFLPSNQSLFEDTINNTPNSSYNGPLYRSPVDLTDIDQVDLNSVFLEKKWKYDFSCLFSYAGYETDLSLLNYFQSGINYDDIGRVRRNGGDGVGGVDGDGMKAVRRADKNNENCQHDVEQNASTFFSIDIPNPYIPTRADIPTTMDTAYDIYSQITSPSSPTSPPTHLSDHQNSPKIQHKFPPSISSWPICISDPKRENKFGLSFSQFHPKMSPFIQKTDPNSYSILYSPPNTTKLVSSIKAFIFDRYGIDIDDKHVNKSDQCDQCDQNPKQISFLDPKILTEFKTIIKNKNDTFFTSLQEIQTTTKLPTLSDIPTSNYSLEEHQSAASDPENTQNTQNNPLQATLDHQTTTSDPQKELNNSLQSTSFTVDPQTTLVNPKKIFSNQKLLEYWTQPSYLPVPLPLEYFQATGENSPCFGPAHSDENISEKSSDKKVSLSLHNTSHTPSITQNRIDSYLKDYSPPIDLWYLFTPSIQTPVCTLSLQIPFLTPKKTPSPSSLTSLPFSSLPSTLQYTHTISSFQFSLFIRALRSKLRQALAKFVVARVSYEIDYHGTVLTLNLTAHYDLVPLIIPLIVKTIQELNPEDFHDGIDAKYRLAIAHDKVPSGKQAHFYHHEHTGVTNSSNAYLVAKIEQFIVGKVDRCGGREDGRCGVLWEGSGSGSGNGTNDSDNGHNVSENEPIDSNEPRSPSNSPPNPAQDIKNGVSHTNRNDELISLDLVNKRCQHIIDNCNLVVNGLILAISGAISQSYAVRIAQLCVYEFRGAFVGKLGDNDDNFGENLKLNLIQNQRHLTQLEHIMIRHRPNTLVGYPNGYSNLDDEDDEDDKDDDKDDDSQDEYQKGPIRTKFLSKIRLEQHFQNTSQVVVQNSENVQNNPPNSNLNSKNVQKPPKTTVFVYQNTNPGDKMSHVYNSYPIHALPPIPPLFSPTTSPAPLLCRTTTESAHPHRNNAINNPMPDLTQNGLDSLRKVQIHAEKVTLFSHVVSKYTRTNYGTHLRTKMQMAYSLTFGIDPSVTSRRVRSQIFFLLDDYWKGFSGQNNDQNNCSKICDKNNPTNHLFSPSFHTPPTPIPSSLSFNLTSSEYTPLQIDRAIEYYKQRHFFDNILNIITDFDLISKTISQYFLPIPGQLSLPDLQNLHDGLKHVAFGAVGSGLLKLASEYGMKGLNFCRNSSGNSSGNNSSEKSGNLPETSHLPLSNDNYSYQINAVTSSILSRHQSYLTLSDAQIEQYCNGSKNNPHNQPSQTLLTHHSHPLLHVSTGWSGNGVISSDYRMETIIRGLIFPYIFNPIELFAWLNVNLWDFNTFSNGCEATQSHYNNFNDFLLQLQANSIIPLDNGYNTQNLDQIDDLGVFKPGVMNQLEQGQQGCREIVNNGDQNGVVLRSFRGYLYEYLNRMKVFNEFYQHSENKLPRKLSSHIISPGLLQKIQRNVKNDENVKNVKNVEKTPNPENNIINPSNDPNQGLKEWLKGYLSYGDHEVVIFQDQIDKSPNGFFFDFDQQ